MVDEVGVIEDEDKDGNASAKRPAGSSRPGHPGHCGGCRCEVLGLERRQELDLSGVGLVLLLEL